MSETEELAAKLAHRTAINEGEEKPRFNTKVFNPYTEFKEFSRKQIQEYNKIFKKWVNTHYKIAFWFIIVFYMCYMWW